MVKNDIDSFYVTEEQENSFHGQAAYFSWMNVFFMKV